MSLTLEEIQYIVPLILRENAWGTLYHKRTKTYIHFGYDYYVYVNSPKFYFIYKEKAFFNTIIDKFASLNGLFVEYESIQITQKMNEEEYANFIEQECNT